MLVVEAGEFSEGDDRHEELEAENKNVRYIEKLGRTVWVHLVVGRERLRGLTHRDVGVRLLRIESRQTRL